MTRKEKDKLRFEFQKFNREFDKKMEKGQIREGVMKLNFNEYLAQYTIANAVADNIIEEGSGKAITANDLMLSNASTVEEPTVRAVHRLLAEHGIKTSIEMVRDNIVRYTKTLRAMYPDDDSYDLALSDAFGW